MFGKIFDLGMTVINFVTSPFQSKPSAQTQVVGPGPTPNPTPDLGPFDPNAIIVNDTLGQILEWVADNWVLVACIGGGLLFLKYFRSR